MVDRSVLLQRAKEMRRNPTETEKRLWRHLSASQLGGYKFRRQAVLEQFIVDFFCPQKALIVEIDGDTHDLPQDAKRDLRLSQKGFRTIRFSNQEVIKNLDGVLMAILEILSDMPDRWPVSSTPNPSSEEEGLK
ncbi:MAG: endonuclease domain-containing protein [Parasphingorhabdus sp.]